MNRRNFLLPVLTQRVVRVRIRAHWTWTIQGADSGNIFEVVGLHQLQKVAHTATIKLEDTQRFAGGQECVCLRIVELQVFQIRFFLTVQRNVFQRVRDDRQVTKTQEVHFQQAECFTRRIVELSDDRAVLGAFHNRNNVGQRMRTHDDRTRVNAPLAGQTFKTERVLNDLVSLRVFFVVLTELDSFGVTLVILVEDAVNANVLAHNGWR